MPNRSVRNLVLFCVWIGIVGVAVVAYLLLFGGGEPETAEGPDQKAEQTEPDEPESKPEEPTVEPAPAPPPSGPTPTTKPPEPKPSPQPTPTPTPAPKTQLMEVPFITWGGDMATFYANGGETTEPDSIFDRLGLKIKLTPGDDFLGQVDRYQRGEIDFLRGTFSMLGLASQKINEDPNTEAVVFLQLTWSAGDHLVAREDCTTLDDLKGKKVAIQRGGPHVGMLNDTLLTAELGWDDIEVVWVDDLSGPNGPAETFRKDSTVAACMVISPDMAALTGDEEPDYELDSVGTGRGESVKGAHILNSTAWMARSICDVYACRKKFYDENRETVEKFVAGYLKACEEVAPLRNAHDPDQPVAKYEQLLTLSQKMFGGEEVIGTTEDVHGLILDCSFVQLPGNSSFFTRDSNRSGFLRKQEAVLDLAVELKEATRKIGFQKPDFDYGKIKTLGRLDLDPTPRPPGPLARDWDSAMGEEVYSFTIPFGPNQSDFSEEEYGDSFQRAIDQASLWGRAGILVRGHADPGGVLMAFAKAGLETGDLDRTGSTGNYQYTWKPTGESLGDLSNTPRVLELVRQQSQNNDEYNRAMFFAEECQRFSQIRADNVRKACEAYARSNNFDLAENQIKSVPVGVVEPVVPTPRSEDDQSRNCRVEFRLVKIAPEALPDFDY